MLDTKKILTKSEAQCTQWAKVLMLAQRRRCLYIAVFHHDYLISLPVYALLLRLSDLVFFFFFFSLSDQLLTFSLDSFHPLPLLVRCSTLHDSHDNLPCINVLKVVLANLVEDAHLFGRCIGIVVEGDEGCGSMVDGMRCRVRQGIEVWLTGSEWGGEDDGMDILYDGLSHLVEKMLRRKYFYPAL